MDKRVVRPAVDREIDEEVAFHVEMRIRELVARGLTPEQARAEALRRFGDVGRVKADLRRLGKRRNVAIQRRQWWGDAWQDLVFALRQLRRTPSFALVAIVTLALAIGANTAVFSVVEGVLLRPLPYGHPNRLVAIWARFLPSTGYDIPKSTLSPEEVLDLKEEARGFSSVTALQAGPSQALTGGDLSPQEVTAWLADASMVQTLDVEPTLGRWFTKAEDAPNGPSVVVLSHALWVSRYGSNRGIVGRSITMNGVSTEVVGVLPAGFSLFLGGSDAGVYLPLRLARSNQDHRGGHLFGAVGRLGLAATLADADAGLAVLDQRRSQASSLHDELWAAPIKTDRLGDAPDVLYLFLAAVALVLLVACANVANLLLARGERRHDEIAVRIAIGAGQERIVRQIVTESLVLSSLALLPALVLARLGTRALIALDPTALPRLAGVHVGLTVLTATASLALVATILFGVAPAVLVSRGAVARGLNRARGGGGRRRGALRRILVAAEVTVTLTVLVLSGLLVRSLRARVATDPGFRAADVLAFDLTLPPSSYPDLDQVGLEYDRLLDALRAIPGAISVSGASAVPFGRHMLRFGFWIEGRLPPRDGQSAWDAVTNWVMPDYFRTLGIPVLKGRPIKSEDDAGAPLVAVVNETAVRRFWPAESPLGKRFHYGQRTKGGTWITIVGVVPDQLRYRVGEQELPEVYLSMLQPLRMQRDLSVVIHTAVDPTSLTSAVRSVVQRFDSALPVGNVHPMASALALSMAQPRLATNLMGTFALLTLVLAVVGLYGVVSYSVEGRRREIGVRVALGASGTDVVRLVTAEGVVPAGAGIVIGLGGAWLATRLVDSMLYGVAPTDTLTFTLLPLALLAVALAASLVPALRATHIAPTEALREE